MTVTSVRYIQHAAEQLAVLKSYTIILHILNIMHHFGYSLHEFVHCDTDDQVHVIFMQYISSLHRLYIGKCAYSESNHALINNTLQLEYTQG